MQGAGDQLLADPALAGDQDRDRRLGRPLAHPLDQAHGRRSTDQVFEGGLAGDPLLQPVHLSGQFAHLQGVADGDGDALGRSRLDQEVLGAGLHGGDHGVDAA